MNIAIVGAGNASLTLLDYFLSDKNIQIPGIADIFQLEAMSEKECGTSQNSPMDEFEATGRRHESLDHRQ